MTPLAKPSLLLAAMYVTSMLGGVPGGSRELVANASFALHSGKRPASYEISGAVDYRYLGDPNREMASYGVTFDSTRPGSSGSVSQSISGIDAKANRWYRFAFRGLPEEGFAVASDQDLYFTIEYFGADGKSYDHVSKPLYQYVEQARRDLQVNGRQKQGGAAAWRTYEFNLRIPFPEITRANLTVGFAHGKGRSRAGPNGGASFYVTDFAFAPTNAPSPDVSTPAPTERTDAAPEGKMLPLGGRWFYLSTKDETAPATFDETNADHLWYHDAVWQAPFIGNMSSVLRAGWKDLKGNVAKTDTPIPNAVTVTFKNGALVIHSANLPNHPTGRFPEMGRGNPSYITQQDQTFYLPLDPKERPGHTVTDATNSNNALNMGPIGIALNGVVFFNPFDMGNTDATDMMDRCCGHPQQFGQYHYHKYPVCVNSPWDDQGTGHSGLLGFAFDGYPLYGPYEEKGTMAKDETGPKALNPFNMHYDKARGWHYHVTPGKFPYLIGGYWGTPDSRDVRQGPPGGGRGRGPAAQGPRPGPPAFEPPN